MGNGWWLVAGRFGHVLWVDFVEVAGMLIALSLDVQGEKRRKGYGVEQRTKQKT